MRWIFNKNFPHHLAVIVAGIFAPTTTLRHGIYFLLEDDDDDDDQS